MALEKGQKIVKLKHSVNSSKSKLEPLCGTYRGPVGQGIALI